MQLTTAFGLGADDSGTAECPVIFRAQPNAEVRLVGGKVIADWQPVTDPAVLKWMDPSARDSVLQADLKAHGVADLGVMVPGSTWGASDPGLEVFFADQPMTLARYPNEDYTTIPEVFGKTPQDTRGTRGCMEGIIGYEGDRPDRWTGETDVMLEGYWFWESHVASGDRSAISRQHAQADRLRCAGYADRIRGNPQLPPCHPPNPAYQRCAGSES